MTKLSARRVETIKIPGFYGDGDGLYLSVKPSGAKSWVLRTVVRGKRRDLGIGSASLVSLAEARDKARELRKVARDGGDPHADRHGHRLTFEEAATQYHKVIAPSFSSSKHAKLWLSGLRLHAFPALGDRALDDIGVADVRKVLEPIWFEKHDTARRIKQRTEAIFDWAKAEGYFGRENPVAGIRRALKPQRRNPQHHAALPWAELPGFYQALIEREGVSARALQYIILTATRSGEVRHARWREISGDQWTIPGSRTKTRRPHRVPLSREACRVLEQVKGLDADYIFPCRHYEAGATSKRLSVNVFRSLYGRMRWEGITTHGFRSTFRDWCSEKAEASREVAEAALAHSLGEVERAYRRSDLFVRRRLLMEQWAEYAASNS